MSVKKLILYIICILFVGFVNNTIAQQPTYFNKSKTLQFYSSDTLVFDTIPINISTLKITNAKNQNIDTSFYIVSPLLGYIVRKNKELKEITISYQYIGEVIFKPQKNKSSNLIQPENLGYINPFAYKPNNSLNNELIDKQGLDMRGSISRGLGFGNSQNLVVNSNLNLQINGKLNDDIDISAVVSDDNNPIQPEGNTQQLQDFDKVYIKLSKNKSYVTLGDFEMIKPSDNYFMKYYKKSRGLQYATIYNKNKKWELSTTAEGAVSRGRFARNIIQAIEGNQGPYRLVGNNGEQFIIIISGTEAIYIDGIKLERGEQNDYTIDYNTGELTFMPKRLINRYTRIIAEFQYADRNYARSVFTFSQSATLNKNLIIKGHFFSEQDHKNQPFQRELNDSEISLLSKIGDNLNLAVIPTEYKTNTFDKSQLLYIKKDTIYDGKSYTIYVFAPIETNDTAYYTVSFNNVGAGFGHYNIQKNAANGRVFEWIAPNNGKLMGSYEPEIKLISPKRMQMITMGSSYKINELTNIDFDIANSNYNRNTFSSIDKQNDMGWGFRGNFKKAINPTLSINKLKIGVQLNYEQVDKNFRYIERYRPVEFDRIWNRNLQNTDRKDSGFAEKIGISKIEITKSEKLKLNHQAAFYNRQFAFNGLQNKSDIKYKIKNTILEGGFEKTDINSTNSVKNLNKIKLYKLSITQLFSKAILKGIYEEEKVVNSIKDIDTVLTGSYHFKNNIFSITNTDTSKIIYGFEYNKRTDFLPLLNQFIQSSIGENYALKFEYNKKPGQRIYLNTTYRIFKADSSNFDLKPENTLLLRLEADWNFLHKLISSNTYYQAGTGQELRRQYSFIEVQPGNGIYQWNDYNNDGIQQLNEFELAIFKDKAKFIKIYQPTTEYIQTNALQLNQTLTINPAATNTKIKWLKKWFWTNTLKLDRKLYFNNNQLQVYNPEYKPSDDTTLVSLNSFTRSSLFFNRSNPIWGIDFNYIDNKNKQLLTNGIDGRSKTEYTTNLRINTKREFSFNATYTQGNKSYISQFFNNRNYWFNFLLINPKINWQWKTFFRVTFYYNYYQAKNNVDYGTESTKNNEGGIELKYNFKENGSISSKISFNHINFIGDINSPIAFEMLNSLQNGNNSLWNLNWQQRVSKNIQLNLSYDGRKNETSKAVHIARVEARYIF
ncbi:MAG: hypothetical protein WCK82_07300 [Bacteroidota bacterium]